MKYDVNQRLKTFVGRIEATKLYPGATQVMKLDGSLISSPCDTHGVLFVTFPADNVAQEFVRELPEICPKWEALAVDRNRVALAKPGETLTSHDVKRLGIPVSEDHIQVQKDIASFLDAVGAAPKSRKSPFSR